MKFSIRLVPHTNPKGDREGVMVAEVLDENGEMVAGLYPTETGCKLLSNNVTGVTLQPGLIEQYHFNLRRHP